MRSNFLPFIAIINFLAVKNCQVYGKQEINELKEHHAPIDEESGGRGVVSHFSALEQNTKDEINDVKKTGNLRRKDMVIEEMYIPPDITSEMKELLALINEERRRYKSSELCFNEKLVIAALRQNEDLIQKYHSGGMYIHKSTLGDRVSRQGYRYWTLGQNNAIMGQGISVQEMYRKTMQSAEQRRNTLNPNFNQIGIDFGRGQNLLFVTQIFGAAKAGETCGSGSGTPPPVDMCDDKEVQDNNYKNYHEWYDAGGSEYNCKWYASDPAECCAKYGDHYRNYGMTAKEACCACGGGYRKLF